MKIVAYRQQGGFVLENNGISMDADSDDMGRPGVQNVLFHHLSSQKNEVSFENITV